MDNKKTEPLGHFSSRPVLLSMNSPAEALNGIKNLKNGEKVKHDVFVYLVECHKCAGDCEF